MRVLTNVSPDEDYRLSVLQRMMVHRREYVSD